MAFLRDFLVFLQKKRKEKIQEVDQEEKGIIKTPK